MGLKKTNRYVIYDEPQRHGGPGTRYFSEESTSTEYRHQAANCFTGADAIDFAKRNNIVIGPLHYVEIEDVTEFDLHR
jgi:hypothetical protein